MFYYQQLSICIARYQVTVFMLTVFLVVTKSVHNSAFKVVNTRAETVIASILLSPLYQ